MTTASTITVVGGILPADVITRLSAGDLPGMTPGDYHLAANERLGAAASAAWDRLQEAYQGFVAAGDTSARFTREKWLMQVLQALGYGRVQVTPGGHLDAGTDEYPISHLWTDVPMHLLGWDVNLDARNPGVIGAARAPQSMVQEFLNRSPEHLWAVLSNGRLLRLLRDSTALAGQAYVEFDLATMFTTDQYSDFFSLFALCHESRLERRVDADGNAGNVTDRWIEQWRTEAIATGTRALASLRGQVEKALETLGTGFYQHPANTDLRARLAAGDITPADYQRGLLRIVYRLLFWFVCDDRDLLLAPDADAQAGQRYRRFFTSARLRQTARKKVGTRHSDLWQQATLVLDALGSERGLPELGLPGLGGLFELGPMDVFTDSQITNTALLQTVYLLSNTTDRANKRRAPVDFAHLGAEELGGIYEALLELHPRLDPGQGTFTLEAAAGNERKTSGSYYTPSDLIALVLDEALDPVLDEAVKAENPEQALLAITVCDPACGSGHFLVAAARRIAMRLATVRCGDSEPAPAQVQRALRDVVGRCIYGVDLNPMAAELAKVSLWLEAVEPGKPLAFLDAHIRIGNALLGTAPALLAKGVPSAAFVALTGDDKKVVSALKKANTAEVKRRESGQLLMDLPIDNAGFGKELAALGASAAGGSLADTHLAAARLRELEASPERREAISYADAWCAAFTQPKTAETAPVAVTDATLQEWCSASAATRDLVAAESQRYRFFHWHLEFPEIFAVDQDLPLGWDGGFTVMVGNPPWERVKLQEKEFFDDVPEIASAANANARKKLIKELPQSDPALWDRWVNASRQAESTSHFLRLSGRYPLTGAGDVNTYQVFAETMRDFIAADGRSGVITPTGLATDATTAPFFADTLRTKRLAAFYDFENEAKIFAGVHNQFRFAATVFARASEIRFAFYTRFISDVPARRYALRADEVLRLNPNTGTLPVFRSRHDAEITLGIYRRHPILVRDHAPETNPWGLSFMRMFDMANDSGLFRTADWLESEGAEFDGWAWHREGSAWLPLYEAKMLSHWDHRYASYSQATQAQLNKGTLPRLAPAQHDDPTCEPLARYWVDEREVLKVARERTNGDWLFGWRDIARASDVRTMVPSALPFSAVGHKLPLAFSNQSVPLLHAAWSSLTFDYVARQKLSGTGMTYFILKQLACPTPDTFAATPAWLDHGLSDWILPRVLELTYTSYRIAGYARDMGDDGEPFRWIPERREAIRAELDAAMMHVYGLQRDETEQVLDSFPVLRKYEERDHGEFRTKRLVLEYYDAMTTAAETGQPYETPIDPPPGEGPRHPARTNEGNAT